MSSSERRHSDTFIKSKNIVHYLDKLKTEADPIRRAILAKLLVREVAKQARHDTGMMRAQG